MDFDELPEQPNDNAAVANGHVVAAAAAAVAAVNNDDDDGDDVEEDDDDDDENVKLLNSKMSKTELQILLIMMVEKSEEDDGVYYLLQDWLAAVKHGRLPLKVQRQLGIAGDSVTCSVCKGSLNSRRAMKHFARQMHIKAASVGNEYCTKCCRRRMRDERMIGTPAPLNSLLPAIVHKVRGMHDSVCGICGGRIANVPPDVLAAHVNTVSNDNDDDE